MPVITLFAYFPDGERILAAGGWATRDKEALPEVYKRLSEKDIENMIRFSKDYKLSSILDFPYYIITIEGVSRVFTHQWVRYRLAAHMQQSMRYVEIDTNNLNWFVIPPTILEKSIDDIVKYIELHRKSAELYKVLIKSGTPVEDARFVLPNSVKTHISTAADAEEFLHIIKQRTCLDAQWEIRIVSAAILAALYMVHPRIFSNWGPHCVVEKRCLGFFKDKTKCGEFIRKIREIYTTIDKYRERFQELERGKILEIDLTDILGYRANDEKKKKLFKRYGEFEIDYKVIVRIRKN